MAPRLDKPVKTVPKRHAKNKDMVRALELALEVRQRGVNIGDLEEACVHGGVVAGIRLAVTSIGSIILGRCISSRVVPTSTLVMPMTGGSPFRTNS